jgi:hypothetical protein
MYLHRTIVAIWLVVLLGSAALGQEGGTSRLNLEIAGNRFLILREWVERSETYPTTCRHDAANRLNRANPETSYSRSSKQSLRGRDSPRNAQQSIWDAHYAGELKLHSILLL